MHTYTRVCDNHNHIHATSLPRPFEFYIHIHIQGFRYCLFIRRPRENGDVLDWVVIYLYPEMIETERIVRVWCTHVLLGSTWLVTI